MSSTVPPASRQPTVSGVPAVLEDLSVVVVTYQAGELLEPMIKSVMAGTARPVEVVVADNGSTDGVPQAVAQASGARLVPIGTNLGYGGGANVGVAATTTDWVLVCNQDIELDESCLAELFAATRRWPRAATLGPLIRTTESAIYPSARALPSLSRGIGHALLGWCWPSNPWTASYRAERGEPTEGPAGWLSGSCLLVRRQAFDSVGGFDPAYFMYFEDVELAYQLRARGWLNVYVPAASILHVGGTATRLNRSRMTAAHHDSAYRYLSRRYAGSRWAAVRAMLWAGLKLRLVLSWALPAVSAGARPARRASRPVKQNDNCP